MALEKKVTYDYEVRGEYKCIQQRTRTAIVEDGEEISFSYHRTSFMPDADVSGESDEVKHWLIHYGQMQLKKRMKIVKNN